MRLVGSLQSYKMEPLIVFSFSRRECEAYSLACANPDMGNLCFADTQEAAAIEEVRRRNFGCVSLCVLCSITCCWC
jgi:superfamily II RNA helicase